VSKQWSENDTLILIEDVLFSSTIAGDAMVAAAPAFAFETPVDVVAHAIPDDHVRAALRRHIHSR
jgi:hypothetical protein